MNKKETTDPTLAQKPAPAMEVTAWRELHRGAMRGFISLQLASGLILHDCTLFEKDTGERWVGMPARSYQTADGKTQYSPTVEFSSQFVATRFKKEAMAAVERYFAEHETEAMTDHDDEVIDDDQELFL
jgi:DNA-binding cell septation regulator SpoVG